MNEIKGKNNLDDITVRVRKLLKKLKFPGDLAESAVATYLAICFGVVEKQDQGKAGYQYRSLGNLHDISTEILRDCFNYPENSFSYPRFVKVLNTLEEESLIIPLFTEGISFKKTIAGTTGKSFIAVHPLVLETLAGEAISENSPLYTLKLEPSSPQGNNPDYNYWFRIKSDCCFGSFVHAGSVINMLFSSIYSAYFFDENVKKIEVIGEVRSSKFLPTIEKLNKPIDSMNIRYFCQDSVSKNQKIDIGQSRLIAGLVKTWYVNIKRSKYPKDIELGAIAIPYSESVSIDKSESGSIDKSKLYSTTFYLQNRFIEVLKTSLQELALLK